MNDERTPTDCRHSFPEKAHPTAEPVTARTARERVFGHVWGTLEPIESAEEVAALLDAMEAEAAQRNTAESTHCSWCGRAWSDHDGTCPQTDAEIDAHATLVDAEIAEAAQRTAEPVTADTPEEMADFLVGYIDTADSIDLSLVATWLSDWRAGEPR
jgi:hypothetical protein